MGNGLLVDPNTPAFHYSIETQKTAARLPGRRCGHEATLGLSGYFSALQQSLPQALPFSLQQAAQLSPQHFLQVLSAASTGAAAERMARARRERDSFIRIGCVWSLRCPLERHDANPRTGGGGTRAVPH